MKKTFAEAVQSIFKQSGGIDEATVASEMENAEIEMQDIRDRYANLRKEAMQSPEVAACITLWISMFEPVNSHFSAFTAGLIVAMEMQRDDSTIPGVESPCMSRCHFANADCIKPCCASCGVKW